ncbi:hypothetical protein K488DRAFT_55777 [Vararia minispora EC-137]|uniref:Uncharacterized protein n=1 Tax=Vararia minispora EC-137 TaxID=1314806 RepID=A0ACB8QDA1_9AGAM|nr:hypothetical protein K488DRAFT_55777 [Vararia minispora EC-137]
MAKAVNLVRGLVLLNGFPHEHPHVAEDLCLSTSYFGTYGSQSIFIPHASCYTERGLTLPELGAVGLTPCLPPDELIWVEEAAVDDTLLPGPWPVIMGITDYLDRGLGQSPSLVEYDESSQQRLATANPRKSLYTLLHLSARSALLALPPNAAHHLSSILPSNWRIYALPREPLPLLPVPKAAVERVKSILDTLRFDPLVARIVESISVPQIKNDVRWLSGEDPLSPIVSRHSFSEGALLAAEWLKEQYEATGATCELKPFLQGFAPNVICRYSSTVNTTATVLISGHYDSRGSFGSPRAPGADDDASGSTGVLSIARTISALGITFRSNVELVAFAGEEQGLYGSRFYAKDLRDENKNLTLMIQADMTAYHAPGEPMQLGMPEFIGTPEVTQLVANISAIYSPELKVGFSPACCSDHQSFHQQGFPATHVFERAGPIADPMYHNSGDLSDRAGYDFDQLKSIAKFATLLHAAGFDLPSDA